MSLGFTLHLSNVSLELRTLGIMTRSELIETLKALPVEQLPELKEIIDARLDNLSEEEEARVYGPLIDVALQQVENGDTHPNLTVSSIADAVYKKLGYR